MRIQIIFTNTFIASELTQKPRENLRGHPWIFRNNRTQIFERKWQLITPIYANIYADGIQRIGLASLPEFPDANPAAAPPKLRIVIE